MARRIKLGANTVTGGPSLAQWANLESRLGVPLDSWLYMNGWGTVGSTQPIWFTSQKNDLATRPSVIPCVAWQPTGPLSAVNDGSWDAYINAQADAIKAMPQPVQYVRLAHEFNGTWTPYGNGSELAADFVTGWRRVVDKFAQRGVTTVKWVWSMTVGWPTASTTDPAPYWPGDTYVDVVGMDVYQNLNSATWQHYDTLVGASYDSLVTLAGPTKPFHLSEFGIAEDGRGSKVDWINKLAWALPQRTPQVEAMFYWDRNMSEGNYTVDSSAPAQAALQRLINGPAVLPANGSRIRPRW